MQAYGLPRHLDIQNPDKADIRNYALKSSIGCFPEKSGDFRGIIKNKGVKARIRRSWKKAARLAMRKELYNMRVLDWDELPLIHLPMYSASEIQESQAVN